MHLPELTTGGAERGSMVLKSYDPDDRDRLCRLLTDLAEYADDAGLNFAGAAVIAVQRAATRRTPAEERSRVEFDLDDAIFGAERYGEPIPGEVS